MPGLGTSFGRGGATTAQQDLVNADAILIIGSSMAEAHPVGFRWVVKAREEHDALVIHVDPRFSRTSALADIWVPIRAGSDIVFFGGLINYVLTQDRVFREYVIAYTNASVLVREDFEGPDTLDGFFSGWQADRQGTTRRRGNTTWTKEAGRSATHADAPAIDTQPARHFARHAGDGRARMRNPARVLVDPRSPHIAPGPDRTATIRYAVGLTAPVGVQCATAAILQLLLATSAIWAAACWRLRARLIKDRPTS